MTEEHTFETSTTIEVSPAKVWEALTTPDLSGRFMWNTQITTDWKPGRPIVWRGMLEGKPFENRGTIVRVLPERILEHTYWSSVSELEDVPENYADITYNLIKEGEYRTKITVTMRCGNTTFDTRKHLEWGWKMVLIRMKNFLEKKRPKNPKRISRKLTLETESDELMSRKGIGFGGVYGERTLSCPYSMNR